MSPRIDQRALQRAIRDQATVQVQAFPVGNRAARRLAASRRHRDDSELAMISAPELGRIWPSQTRATPDGGNTTTQASTARQGGPQAR